METLVCQRGLTVRFHIQPTYVGKISKRRISELSTKNQPHRAHVGHMTKHFAGKLCAKVYIEIRYLRHVPQSVIGDCTLNTFAHV
jgi:hypothetical protein